MELKKILGKLKRRPVILELMPLLAEQTKTLLKTANTKY